MKIYDVLSKYALSEIRSQLRDMEWVYRADREYKAWKLNIFLKALNYVFWDRGFEFKLKSGQGCDNPVPKVEVHKYTDPADYLNGEKHLFDIFSDHIEDIENTEES